MKRFLLLLFIFFLSSTPALATTYYVDADEASESCNGQYATHVSNTNCPFNTIQDVESGVSGEGDDVFFQCGDTWTDPPSFQLDWAGTQENYSVVGAYYVSGGTVTSQDGGFSTATCGTLPKFDSEWDGNSNNTNKYGNFIQIEPTAANMRFEYIWVYNVRGNCLRINGSSVPENFIASYNKFEICGEFGINFRGASSSNKLQFPLAEYNEVTKWGWFYKLNEDGVWDGTASGSGSYTISVSSPGWTTDAYFCKHVHITSGTASGEIYVVKSNTSDTLTVYSNYSLQQSECGAYPPVGDPLADGVSNGDTFEILNGAWPKAINFRRTNNGIARYNYVHQGIGEGIGGPEATSNSYVGNVVIANSSVGIYVAECGACSALGNWVFGTTDSDYHIRNEADHGVLTSYNGEGFVLGGEQARQSSTNSTVKDNIIAGRFNGVRCYDSTDGGISHEDMLVWNNTFINNNYNIGAIDSNDTTTYCDFSYNIFYDNETNGHQVYNDPNPLPSNFTVAHGNVWYNNRPSDSDWQNAGDIQTDPNLSKTSGWMALANLASLSDTDPTILEGSSAIDAGISVNLLKPDGATFTTSPIVFIQISANEMGAYGYEEVPPGVGGDTGLYAVMGGDNELTLGGTNTITLSAE